MTKQYDNFADLITFTRASTGTYLDSDGLLKTATTNTPRIEYDINGNRKGLLIEEARTNTMIRSEEFDNAQWTKGNFGSVGLLPVVTANQAIAPDGTLTADRIVFDAVDSTGISDVTNFSATALTGVCTASVWLKAETGTPTVRVRIDWFGGSYAENFVLTNKFQRYVVTMPSNQSGAIGVNKLSIRTRPAVGTSISATVLAWGAQLEAGSFPTSYIPTAGAAASRSADVASIPTSAFGYNADKGTVVVDFEVSNYVSGSRRLFSLNTDVQNRMDGLLVSNGQFQQFVFDGGSTQVNPNTINSITNNEPSKAAAVYALNDFASVLDDGAIVTDTSGTVPPVNTLSIGTSPNNTWTNGYIKSIRYWPRRLTNSQLQRLTS